MASALIAAILHVRMYPLCTRKQGGVMIRECYTNLSSLSAHHLDTGEPSSLAPWPQFYLLLIHTSLRTLVTQK